MLQLDLQGSSGAVTATELDVLRGQFAECGGVFLRGLLSPPLLFLVDRRCRSSTFIPRDLGALGVQLRCEDAAVETALTLTLNRAPFLQLLESITGRSALRSIGGHIARLSPDSDQQLTWHDDGNQPGRLLGLSVNLGFTPYEGGVFQLRAKQGLRLLWNTSNTGPGDAMIFTVDGDFEHRVTPVTGEVARTVFAGWAMDTPFVPGAQL